MKYSRHIVILVSVVFLASCLAELSAGRVAPGVERAEDPDEDSMILVEAFMVEAPLAKLYRMGVPVVSKGAKSVSAEVILKCLEDPKGGAVTAGAKLAVHKGIEARTETNTKQGYYVGPPKEQKLTFEDFGVSLTAQGGAIPGGRIGLNLEFKHRGLQEGDNKGEALPIVTERNWACGVSLEPGKPMLVGAAQDEETAVFLLVTADIMK